MRTPSVLASLLSLLVPIVSWAGSAGVIVSFDPSTPQVGPFPSDFLTVPDPGQKTGLRVNMPLPDCVAQPTGCVETTALNQLDGFALQPRIVVKFSGPIDPSTLQNGILLVWLGNLTTEEQGLAPMGTVTAVNQVIYDPATQTAYAKPNDFFDQHRQYALLVTDAIHDPMGNPAQADPNFQACVQMPANGYCTALQATLGNISVLAAPANVIAASTFTTMTATSWLEKARDLSPAVAPQVTSTAASMTASTIKTVTLHAQVGVGPVQFQDFPTSIPAGFFAGVDRIVFNNFQSPNFLNAQEYIVNTPTGSSLTTPPTSNTIQVHTFVPSSAMPAAGYPVIIFGHGFSENSFESPTVVAPVFAKAGYAVMAINAVGHGYGPQTTIRIANGGVNQIEVPAGGRGVDLNGDGQILDYEGCVVTLPAPVALRDCLRQTVVDLLQLKSAIRSGALLENASGVRLDPSRIYYAGLSLGAIYGSMLHAVDENILVAALVSGGGSIVDINRWTQNSFLHDIARDLFAARLPPLLNEPNDFNDNYVLRNQPVKVNNVPGAIDLQNDFAVIEWLGTGGDPLSYATHLALSPLPGVPPKQALFLIPEGDQTVPNPQESALIRAAGMLSSTSVYRYDLAAPAAKKLGFILPADPHTFLVDVTSTATGLVATAAQQIVAGYLTSNGATIPVDAPNAQAKALLGITLFQAPAGYLETLNF